MNCTVHPDQPVYCKGLCRSCYQRQWDRGTTAYAFLPIPRMHEPDDDGFTFSPLDPRHGERASYTNFKCRCPACTEANNIYMADWKRRTR